MSDKRIDALAAIERAKTLAQRLQACAEALDGRHIDLSTYRTLLDAPAERVAEILTKLSAPGGNAGVAESERRIFRRQLIVAALPAAMAEWSTHATANGVTPEAMAARQAIETADAVLARLDAEARGGR